MPIFEKPHTNLVQAYVNADDYLERYWETDGPDRKALLAQSADVLCRALDEIASDETFWRELDKVADSLGRDGLFEKEVEPLLKDLAARGVSLDS